MRRRLRHTTTRANPGRSLLAVGPGARGSGGLRDPLGPGEPAPLPRARAERTSGGERSGSLYPDRCQSGTSRLVGPPSPQLPQTKPQEVRARPGPRGGRGPGAGGGALGSDLPPLIAGSPPPPPPPPAAPAGPAGPARARRGARARLGERGLTPSRPPHGQDHPAGALNPPLTPHPRPQVRPRRTDPPLSGLPPPEGAPEGRPEDRRRGGPPASKAP